MFIIIIVKNWNIGELVAEREREHSLLKARGLAQWSGVITWMGSTVQWGYHMDG